MLFRSTTRAVKSELLLFETATEGAGSGSVLDTTGHILTNFHVIEGAQKARVTLFNGASYDATLVGQDPPNDIAVIKIAAPPEDLYPIEFGDSSRLRVGQRIFAIGNPFGLERTMTIGIISSLNRSLGRSFKSMIQIDAALNRGNSGGPLIDSKGRLIGMNTAIASSTVYYAGYGFAIPVGLAKIVWDDLIAHGHIVRAQLGVSVGPVTAEDAEAAKLPSITGVKVEDCNPSPTDSPACKSGITPGDVILTLDGKPVDRV